MKTTVLSSFALIKDRQNLPAHAIGSQDIQECHQHKAQIWNWSLQGKQTGVAVGYI